MSGDKAAPQLGTCRNCNKPIEIVDFDNHQVFWLHSETREVSCRLMADPAPASKLSNAIGPANSTARCAHGVLYSEHCQYCPQPELKTAVVEVQGERCRKWLDNLTNFLADDSGMTSEEINQDLRESGIDPNKVAEDLKGILAKIAPATAAPSEEPCPHTWSEGNKAWGCVLYKGHLGEHSAFAMAPDTRPHPDMDKLAEHFVFGLTYGKFFPPRIDRAMLIRILSAFSTDLMANAGHPSRADNESELTALSEENAKLREARRWISVKELIAESRGSLKPPKTESVGAERFDHENSNSAASPLYSRVGKLHKAIGKDRMGYFCGMPQCGPMDQPCEHMVGTYSLPRAPATAAPSEERNAGTTSETLSIESCPECGGVHSMMEIGGVTHWGCSNSFHSRGRKGDQLGKGESKMPFQQACRHGVPLTVVCQDCSLMTNVPITGGSGPIRNHSDESPWREIAEKIRIEYGLCSTRSDIRYPTLIGIEQALELEFEATMDIVFPDTKGHHTDVRDSIAKRMSALLEQKRGKP